MRQNLGTALTVTATDKWLSYIQAGQAFVLGARMAAGAGVINHVQLFNPVGSGKTVLARRVIVSCSVVDGLDLNIHNAALATDAGAGINMLSGGAAGVAHIRTQQNAAELGTVVSPVSNPALTPFVHGGDWLFQLAPGQGALVCHFTVNENLNGTWFWAEF